MINNCKYCGDKPLEFAVANDLNNNGERCFKYVIRCPSCSAKVFIYNKDFETAKKLCIENWNKK